MQLPFMDIIQALLNIILETCRDEKELYLRYQEALQSKIVLDNLLANMPGHIYWKDTNGVYLGCNDKQAQSLGFQKGSELMGKTDFEIPWDSQSAKRFWENDLLVLKTGQSKMVEEPAIVNGKPAVVLSLKSPLLDHEGQVTGILGISIDITRQKEAEENLIKAKETAEAANQAKTEFLENMRHDIRTPLVGITGCAHAIKESIGDAQKMEEVKEWADNLITSGNALFHLLNEILDITKLASGEIPFVKKKFDLKEKLLNIIQLNQSKANQKHLELILEHDDRIPHYLIGDPTRIQRTVLELVTNALNFTNDGHVKISTQLADMNEKSVVIKIKVEDTGIGIALDKQQEVFTRFKRLTPSFEGIYKGAGLGLSIVKQFIDELDGEIYLESKPEKGSTFTCIIPLKEALLDESFGADNMILELPKMKLHPIKKKKSVTKIKVRLDKPTRILLVEDDKLVAKVTESLLAGINCVVDIATDGQLALQYAKNNDYDLIFMDVGLPDASGNEITKQIRQWENLRDKHTPIIALTAHIDTESKEKCLRAGMEAVLSKPLSQDTAVDVLNAFIPRRSKLQKLARTSQKEDVKKEGELFQLPEKVIDLELGKSLMGDELNSAKEMLQLLVEALPKELVKLREAHESQDWDTIQTIVHKLHGGTAYCGTPRLKTACFNLENYLKNKKNQWRDSLYNQLIREIEAVEKSYLNGSQM